jgi:hypothetical protein
MGVEPNKAMVTENWQAMVKRRQGGAPEYQRLS